MKNKKFKILTFSIGIILILILLLLNKSKIKSIVANVYSTNKNSANVAIEEVWAKSISGYSEINDTKATSDGGYVVAGAIAESCDLNGDGTKDVTSVGDFDSIIVKYDKDGIFEWYKSFGTIGTDKFQSVELTEDGGYLVSGYENSNDFKEGVIIKLDSSGNTVWKKVISGELDDIVNQAIVLSNGDIVAVGKFYSTEISFDNKATLSNLGNYNGFIVCYSSNGTFKWAQNITSANEIEATSVTETSKGIVISASGYLNGTINGNVSINEECTGAVIFGEDLDGTYKWHATMNCKNDWDSDLEAYVKSYDGKCLITKLVTDLQDNVIAVGSYRTSGVEFKKDNNSISIAEVGYETLNISLILKVSSDGEYIFSKYFDTENIKYINTFETASVTKDGSVIIGGFSLGYIDYDGDGEEEEYNDWWLEGCDGIVIELNSQNEIDWEKSIMGDVENPVCSVAELADGRILALGNFNSSTISVNGEEVLSKVGYTDTYMIKLVKKFKYSIEYYYDGQIDDSKTENLTAELSTVIDSYTDNSNGANLYTVENFPLTVGRKAADNVIKVYYNIYSDDWDTTKIKVVRDTDGTAVPVPVGYTASSADGEHTVSTGFVIYEGDGEVTNDNALEASKTRNQWVWVPVPDVSRISTLETYGNVNLYTGKSYSYSETGRTEKTNDYLSIAGSAVYNYYNKPYLLGTLKDNFIRDEIVDYNETIKSIIKYGGFYIGRYETGNLSETDDSNEYKELVIQRMNTDLKSKASNGLDLQSVKYRRAAALAANSNVKSGIIWESLWDETLQWFIDTGSRTYNEIAVDSSSWGNYYSNSIEYTTTDGTTAQTTENTAAEIPTGSSEQTKTNNVYDMAGNDYEMTREEIFRGGNFKDETSISAVEDYNGSYSSDKYSCRMYLYIK